MQCYVCTICGYIHDEAKQGPWEALPAGWSCPICGAGKDAFRVQASSVSSALPQKPHVDRELSLMELSIICSNLARGCEKQYLADEAASFRKLADVFRAQAKPAEDACIGKLLELVEQDLSLGYPYGNAVAQQQGDRGALRCQVWSEKVTRMLQSLLKRYQAEGDAMLENTGVWVCTICGFIYVGDAAPALCPVCKVPAWKFEEVKA